MQKVVYSELRDRDIYLDINAGQWMAILKGLAAKWVAWRERISTRRVSFRSLPISSGLSGEESIKIEGAKHFSLHFVTIEITNKCQLQPNSVEEYFIKNIFRRSHNKKPNMGHLTASL